MKSNYNLVQRTYNTCKALMSMTFIKMLEYDRIDLSEGIDVNKNISTSKKWLWLLVFY